MGYFYKDVPAAGEDPDDYVATCVKSPFNYLLFSTLRVGETLLVHPYNGDLVNSGLVSFDNQDLKNIMRGRFVRDSNHYTEGYNSFWKSTNYDDSGYLTIPNVAIRDNSYLEWTYETRNTDNTNFVFKDTVHGFWYA